ncbi:MAG: SAP domain-containing protein [Dehalococcoidia bacterium]|jgi:hypothetical protein
MQQWYDCPQCKQLVQYGQPNCLSCGIQLIWPTQQQSQPPYYQQQLGTWGQQQGNSTGFDWKRSKAHLLLLSKFIHGQRQEYSESWGNVLGEPSNQAITRFINEGSLTTADLNDHLSYKYKVPELKDMLKQRGLPVSGRKDEMIQRLVQVDTDGMRKAVAELTLLKCTQRGQEIAEQYLVAEKEKRSNVEKQVIEYLRQRRFREASLTVAAYESEQVFSRGMGVDWRHYNPSHDIERLETIFRSKPKIVAQLRDEKLEALRIGAAMMELWGTNTAMKWLPDNFETGLSIDNDAAARMFLFQAGNQAQLESYRKEGVSPYVEILATSESCDSCKRLEGKRYKLSNAPELPNPHCTHKLGCRCVYLPCVD